MKCFVYIIFGCFLFWKTHNASSGVSYQRLKDHSRSSNKNNNKIFNRLPRNLIPTHYDLSIFPDISRSKGPPFPFSGKVSIYFDCVENTDVLILNAIELKADPKTVTITSSPLDTKRLNTKKTTPEPVFQSLTEVPIKNELHFKVVNKFLKSRKYLFQANYSGVMGNFEAGLYWDSYIGLDNSKKYIAATQLQPINARMMFPCFDEIDMKATFNISVKRLSKTHIAISNMPKIKTVRLSNEFAEDYFYKTPIMSTYLLCVVVGEFKQVVAPTLSGSNTKISLYATDVQVNNLDYMTNFAVTTLQKWFNDNTGYPYKEPKLDHVALPSKMGAMENWGLITYGEETLCINKETTSIVGKFSGIVYVSHELAHMWYGNLVTCKWWNDIWLHEGFATYYNYNPIEYLGWEWMETQQSDMYQGIQYFMTRDQKNTTITVRKHIASPQKSETAFSDSAYIKGGAIIRMLQGILTRPILNKAIKKYLFKNAYKNTVMMNFANELNEQARMNKITYPNNSPLDFKAILNPWLNQIGFPLLKAERFNRTHVAISQTHYLHPANQSVSRSSKYNYRWEIPVTKVTKHGQLSDWDKTPTSWMHVNESSKLISLEDSIGNWFIVNPRQNFFYRVLYDITNRNNLIKQLKLNHEVIPPETRSQLIDDNFDLARNLYLPAIEALDFTDYLSSEFTYNPWVAALKHFYYIAAFFEADEFYPQIQIHFRKRLDKVLERIGYTFLPNDTVLLTYLRKDAIASACPLGSQTCLSRIRSLYTNYIINPEINSVNPNVLPTVLCHGVHDGSDSDFQTIYDQYNARKTSQVKDERHAYIFALACTKSTKLLDKLFNDIVDGKTFNLKDVNQAIQYLASTPYGAEIVWNYLEKHWLKPAEGIHKFQTITTITDKWHTVKQLQKLNNFIGDRLKNITPSKRETLKQNILKVELNVKFYEENIDKLRDWFTKRIQSRQLESHSEDIDENNGDDGGDNGGDVGENEEVRKYKRFSPLSAHQHWNLLQNRYNRENNGRNQFQSE